MIILSRVVSLKYKFILQIDFMKKFILTLCVVLTVASAWACTSAIVSGKLTPDGRPLLWKHRDTGEENNKVERIKATKNHLEYVALFNASDTKCREAWMGYNSAGFAIMNTASYNLKSDTVDAAHMDKEGSFMRKALERCHSVSDFKNFLDTLKRPLRVEANFGVIDAQGEGGYFETNNYTYTFYDLNKSEDGILTRTNYSYSGRVDAGFGYIREQNEKDLLAPFIKQKAVTPEVFTEKISRTYYHSLLGEDFTNSGKKWLVDQDFIPRRISTASTVIAGVLPGENPLLTHMWIGIGYPPCSEVRLVWLGENGVPKDLQGVGESGHSPLCDIVVARKNIVYNLKRGSGKEYINLSKLYNAEGTGFCQVLKPINAEYYRKGKLEIDRRRNQLKK